MKKRGQAAMEFLMTYGWAILAAIIVIAILAIYFRPSSLVTENAVVTAPLYAVGTTINATSVQLEIRNNGGEDLNVTESTLTFSTPTLATCDDASANADNNMGTTLSAGASKVITYANCANMGTSTVTADVAITYTRPGSTLEQSSTGTISGRV